LQQSALLDVQISADAFDNELREISYLTYLLKLDHENYFSNFNNLTIPVDTSGYVFHESGKLLSILGYNTTSLLCAIPEENYEIDYKKVYTSEQMEAVFKRVVKSSINVESAFFNSNDGMSRRYPYVSYPPEILRSDVDIREYPFYYMADEERNLSGNHVWTDLYYELAGNGWVVSCLVPIYSNGELEGVSGVNIDINRMLERLLNDNIAVKAVAFVTKENGELLALNNAAANLFSTEKVTLFTDNQLSLAGMFNEDIYSDKMDIDLMNSIISAVPINEEYSGFQIEDTEYFLTRIAVPETNWYYYNLIRNEDLLAPLEVLNEDKKKAYVILGALMLTLNGFLILLVYQAQKKFSNKLTSPIIQLAQDLRDYDIEKSQSFNTQGTGINELDELEIAFKELIHQVEHRSDRIVSIEKEKILQERQIARLDEISNKDVLTGLDNRRRLEEILDVELYRAKRYKESLTTILLDIDNFKSVNDTFGHSVGDAVLRELAFVVRDNIRTSDYFCRWGGEEFQIVSPETSKEGALILAEKLREIIEAKDFAQGVGITASFGVTEFNPLSDDKYSMFDRVDAAMYIAKAKGRNKVVFKE
jgi:diguanylate cyclase (GGDEF)-like protein